MTIVQLQCFNAKIDPIGEKVLLPINDDGNMYMAGEKKLELEEKKKYNRFCPEMVVFVLPFC